MNLFLPQLQPADSSGWNELYITVQSCRDLQFSGPQQPSPYVVYKFSNFPDHPTTTVHDSCHPHFNDLKSYSVPMDVDLDQYLKSELIQFYVFDYKEEQMDVYMGKARVALLPLAQDQEIAGEGSLFMSNNFYFSWPEIALALSFCCFGILVCFFKSNDLHHKDHKNSQNKHKHHSLVES